MSKATWAYRLPTPHAMKHSLFPFQPQPGVGPRTWHATHLENYEHLRTNAVLPSRTPQQVFLQRDRKLKRVKQHSLQGRPLWALDELQEMYEQDLAPCLEHYREVLAAAAHWDEPQTAKDCWALLERQGVIPDDKTLCCWFEVCAAFRWRDEALQVWNRYCTEFSFLREGEPDPKPVTRERHTLTRDDYYNLPWWKKRWDFDPNHDVPDAHRFNRTREIYASAAAALWKCGEEELGGSLMDVLERRLPSTPTPVAEPLPDPNVPRASLGVSEDNALGTKQVRYRIPNIYLFTLRRNTRGVDWVPNHEWLIPEHKLGASAPTRSRDTPHGDPRFYTNLQYLVYAYEKVLRAAGDTWDESRIMQWTERVLAVSGEDLNLEDYFVAELEALVRGPRAMKPQEIHERLHQVCEKHALRPVPAMYLPVFRAFYLNLPVGDASAHDFLYALIKELHRGRHHLDLLTHTEVLRAHQHLGTLKAHDYFVQNVLREHSWDNEQISILLKEYRAIGDAGDHIKQKKHCERAYIWCSRYNVGMNEANKQYIEDDYDRIKVQVRTKEELVVWKMKRQNEMKNQLTPTLPNPVTDRVTHTLNTPDHIRSDHLHEWAVPYSNAGRTFNWQFSQSPHLPEAATDVRDLTDINRLRYLPQKNLVSPWVTRSKWNPKSGYRPERQHERLNVNRWLEETNKAFPGN